MLRSFPLPILLSLLILAGIIGYAFGPCLSNDFVNWDDQTEIIQNPDFNPVTWKGLMWNWSHTRLTLYMPVTYMVWGATAFASPRDSRGVLTAFTFHALNMALHLACCGLVFALILQLWRRVLPALVGATVFAVHPLQAEPVAWASGMYTLLSTGLSLGGMVGYVAFAQREKKRTSNVERRTLNVEVDANAPSLLRRSMFDVRRSTFDFTFPFATILYIAALFTKAASVSLPLAAAVIDLLILGRPVKRVILTALPWILLGLPIIVVARHFQDVSQISTPPLWGRPVVALDALGFYLRKIVWPVNLIPDYGRNPTWVMQHPAPVFMSVATAMIALLLAWVERKRVAWITAGIGILVVGISPYLGLTPFDFQYVSTVADRYAYFGMVGAAILAAGLVVRWRSAAIVLLIAVSLGTILTHRQVQRWRDTQSLFGYTLAVNPASLVSHNVLGFIAAGEGRRADAEAHYRAALRIWPEDAAIHFNLGNLYLPALAAHPDRVLEQYALAVKYQPKFAVYRNSYASALARSGRVPEAYEQWQQAIADDPQYIDARNNFADLLANLGRTREARQQCLAVLAIDPTNAHATALLAASGG